MILIKKLKNIANYFCIDKAVFLLLSGRILAAFAGLFSTVLIGIYFSPTLQGYFYTFVSLVALKTLAELGMNIVTVTFISHEVSLLKIKNTFEITGDATAINRLRTIGRFVFKWYFFAGILSFILLLITGIIFFNSNSYTQDVNWQFPWLYLCLFTGFGIIIQPVWSILEGCHQTERVYSFRFKQILISNMAVWICIIYEQSLWVLVVSSFIEFFYAIIIIVTKYKILLIFFLKKDVNKIVSINWRKNIFPMQWRIGLSWISGYLTFYLFTPVLFYYHGPVIAGKMGITWIMINGLTSIVSSWVTPKVPIFSLLIATSQFEELDKQFWKITKIIFIMSLSIAAGIWITTYVMYLENSDYADKILEPLATFILLLATVILTTSLPMSVYLRSNKSDPLFVISIFGGILNVFFVILFGKYFSSLGVSLGYLLVTLIQLPFVIKIWNYKRKKWSSAY